MSQIRALIFSLAAMIMIALSILFFGKSLGKKEIENEIQQAEIKHEKKIIETKEIQNNFIRQSRANFDRSFRSVVIKRLRESKNSCEG